MLKNRATLLFILLIVCGVSAFAQSNSKVDYTIKYEPKVESFLNDVLDISQRNEFEKGWQIQLLSTVDRTELEYQMNKFQNLFPSLDSDWVHERPYYKINVGAFLKREDAIRVLFLVQEEFPSAICKKSGNLKKSTFLN
jgi:hypothetical protein